MCKIVDCWVLFPTRQILKLRVGCLVGCLTSQLKALLGQASWELDSTINYLTHLTFNHVVHGVQQRQLSLKARKVVCIIGLQVKFLSESQFLVSSSFQQPSETFQSLHSCQRQYKRQTFAHRVRSSYHCTDPLCLPFDLNPDSCDLVTGPVNTPATEQNIVDSCNCAVSSVLFFGDFDRCNITSLGVSLEQHVEFHTRLNKSLCPCLKLVPVPLLPRTMPSFGPQQMVPAFEGKHVFLTWNVWFGNLCPRTSVISYHYVVELHTFFRSRNTTQTSIYSMLVYCSNKHVYNVQPRYMIFIHIQNGRFQLPWTYLSITSC